MGTGSVRFPRHIAVRWLPSAFLCLTACARGSGTADGRQHAAPVTQAARSGQGAPGASPAPAALPRFDRERAVRQLSSLAELGQRYYGAPRRGDALDRLEAALREATPHVLRQTFAATESLSGETYQLTNLIGRLHPDARPRVILGSHFDTRLWAEEDRDPTRRSKPIMGANDGTSGVAVVLEVLRAVAADPGWADFGLDVVLFDGEEFGRPGNRDYCRGSIHFASEFDTLYPDDKPVAALVLDMVGDRDLGIPRERSSDAPPSRWLDDLVFEVGRRRAPGVFSDRVRSTITDDHSPLQQLGIPAVLIIDLDYPYWHTQADTLDKISADSLATVGSVVIESLHRIRARYRRAP